MAYRKERRLLRRILTQLERTEITLAEVADESHKQTQLLEGGFGLVACEDSPFAEVPSPAVEHVRRALRAEDKEREKRRLEEDHAFALEEEPAAAAPPTPHPGVTPHPPRALDTEKDPLPSVSPSGSCEEGSREERCDDCGHPWWRHHCEVAGCSCEEFAKAPPISRATGSSRAGARPESRSEGRRRKKP